MKVQSQEEYSQQLQDQLSSLWISAAQKRKQLQPNRTTRSVKLDKSQSIMDESISAITNKETRQLTQKLQQEQSATKHRDLQITNLNQIISQLTNERNMLLTSIDHIYSRSNENNPRFANESSLDLERTNHHNFNSEQPNQNNKISNNKGNVSKGKVKVKDINHTTISQLHSQQIKLQSLSRNKIIELLRSTAEYRYFSEYHDSHHIDFMQSLYNEGTHNKRSVILQQSKEWNDIDALLQLRNLNQKQELSLKGWEQELIVGKVKRYYERTQEQKLKQMKHQYQQKLNIIAKDQNSIPSQLIEVCRQKQKELAQQMISKKTKKYK